VALISVLALLGAACGDDAGQVAGADSQLEVTAEDFSFDPNSLTLEQATVIELTFTNEGEQQHSFTSDDVDVDIEAEGGGNSVTVTFTTPGEPGTYEFVCRFHSNMRGSMTVGDEAATGESDDGGRGEYGATPDPETGEGLEENDDGTDG
jgi:plastocyanin